ncbi:MAG: DUF1285 domain-containing protein [Asticcacaulis sp.]
MDLSRLYTESAAQGPLPPVDQWHPPFCGDSEMRITHDGTWLHQGRPIERPAMVALFSRILRKEGDSYFLVTPVEKLSIRVDDVPFIAVEMTRAVDGLMFRTQLGDTVMAGADHPLRFDNDTDGFRPYIEVRKGLFARLSRALTQELVALSEVSDHQGAQWLGVRSGGVFFPMAPASSLF